MALVTETKRSSPQHKQGGMLLELDPVDVALLESLVKRYQVVIGGAFKATKVFVVRQLLRHWEKRKPLPPLYTEPASAKAKIGMVLELGEGDRPRLGRLVTRYKKEAPPPSPLRCSKTFVIRQLLRHTSSGKSLPPVR